MASRTVIPRKTRNPHECGFFIPVHLLNFYFNPPLAEPRKLMLAWADFLDWLHAGAGALHCQGPAFTRSTRTPWSAWRRLARLAYFTNTMSPVVGLR